MNDIKKVAFVTGASRGIGRAIVEKLASDGFKVGFSYVSSDEKAKAIVDELTARGLEVFSVKFDVKNFQEVEDAFDKIYEEHGRIDVLVNNAGITRDKLFSRMKEDDFDQVIDTNLKGIFNCSKQVARKMSKQKSGRIINISSLAGLVGNIGQVNYSASKAGVIGFTRSLAAELGAYGITVNAVAPGLIKTDMTDAIPDQIREGMIKAIPLKRIGQPEDIGNIVGFLAGDAGSYITGQVISVDGGLSSI
jgi:3-oxoacyl-[acyl-carrier-protein] reductase